VRSVLKFGKYPVGSQNSISEDIKGQRTACTVYGEGALQSPSKLQKTTKQQRKPRKLLQSRAWEYLHIQGVEREHEYRQFNPV
jgi:hypothetical protein